MRSSDTPKISILLPTRGRPAGMRRLLESAQATASGPLEVVYYIDDDDRASIAEAAEQKSSADVVALIGPRIVLSDCWNRCAAVARAEILMQCNDDIIF